MANIRSPIQPLYKTGEQQGGEPTSGSGTPYGMVPSLPPYITDTSQTIGTDIYSQLVQNLPGYERMVGKSSSNIADLLAGRIPADVLNLMGQTGAERGVAMGSPGSPNAMAAYMRALGLTSLGLQQAGEGELTSAIQRTPIQQNQITTNTQDLSALIAQLMAAPDPNLAAQEELAAQQKGLGAGLAAGRTPVPGAAPTSTSTAQPTSSIDAQQAYWDKITRGLGTAGQTYTPTASYMAGLYGNLPTGGMTYKTTAEAAAPTTTGTQQWWSPDEWWKDAGNWWGEPDYTGGWGTSSYWTGPEGGSSILAPAAGDMGYTGGYGGFDETGVMSDEDWWSFLNEGDYGEQDWLDEGGW